MAIMNVKLDLDRLGYTEQQVLDFIKDSPFEYEVQKTFMEQWAEHCYQPKMLDITKGWELIGNVKDWSPVDGPYEPGAYALVFDPSGRIKHPILQASTFVIGETTQPGHKRIATHSGALRGKSTNMSDKYRKHLPTINQWAGENITKNLGKVKIFFRPHSVDTEVEEKWHDQRPHSLHVESLCMASYHACWNHFPVGNTRDLPHETRVEQCRKMLVEAGYNM